MGAAEPGNLGRRALWVGGFAVLLALAAVVLAVLA